MTRIEKCKMEEYLVLKVGTLGLENHIQANIFSLRKTIKENELEVFFCDQMIRELYI